MASFFVTGCSQKNAAVSRQAVHTSGVSDIGTETVEKSVQSDLCDPVADFVASMTLEEKICQLFIVAVDGTEAHTSAIVYDIPPGGYILFNRNFTGSAEHIIKLTGDVQTFYADLREASGQTVLHCAYGNTPVVPRRVPPFFAIDHEGGEVNRLRGIASPLPSAESVARFLKTAEAEKLYGYAAEQIAALGIHVNFAPLAETLGPHNEEFVGLRSFGSLERVQAYASSFIRVFGQNRVFCVLKHFPGNTNDDPHTVLPVLKGTASEIEQLYFAPFFSLLASLPVRSYEPPCISSFPAAGVLMSHARVESFDKKNPACFSPVLIREVLQKKLHFDGLIFSDDLYMGALASSDFSPAEAAEKALRAGVHMFMLSRSRYRDFIPAFVSKAASDPCLSSLIDEAATKIMRAKLFMGLLKLTECEKKTDSSASASGSAQDLRSMTLEASPLDELYNTQAQIRRFNDAKQKGDALYYAYWAK